MTRGVKGPAVHRRCRQCKAWFLFRWPRQRFCSVSCSAQYRNAQPKWRKAHSEKIKAVTDPVVMRERAKALWCDPQVRAVLTESTRKRANSKEHLAWLAEHNEQMWADKEHRKKHAQRTSERLTTQWRDPEYREAMKAQTTKLNKERWADPEYKEKTSRGIRVGKLAPLVKKKEIAAARERAQRPEERERVSQMMQDRWKDPEMRAKMIENSSKNARDNWANNPEYRRVHEKVLTTWARSPENRTRLAALNKSRKKEKGTSNEKTET